MTARAEVAEQSDPGAAASKALMRMTERTVGAQQSGTDAGVAAR